jgi:5-hydroxyisourate hydrolase
MMASIVGTAQEKIEGPPMSPITTHVLDLGRGKPAEGVPVVLEQRRGDDGWIELARGITNREGRLVDWWPGGASAAATYRLRFDTSHYFAQQGGCFYPEVSVTFEISQPQEHHHIPVLLNAHGYTTYRGS